MMPAGLVSGVAAVDRLRGKGSVAVVVASDVVGILAALPDAIELGDDGLAAPVTVVQASLVKGLEFDHVVLVEPNALSLRVLYVAMTRAVTSLTIVGDLPAELVA